MNLENYRVSLTRPVVLPFIPEDQEIVNSRKKIQFLKENVTPQNPTFNRFRETANKNICKMNPDTLKQSVDSNPFMQAKLKCLIKLQEESLNKQNWIRSPANNSEKKIGSSKRFQTVYSMKKEKKSQEKEKITKLVQILNENQLKCSTASNVASIKFSNDHKRILG